MNIVDFDSKKMYFRNNERKNIEVVIYNIIQLVTQTSDSYKI